MKRISIVFTLAIASLFILSSCLKDKGFEDGTYGTDIKEVKGVAFPQAASSPVVIGVNSVSTSQTLDVVAVVLELDGLPTTDVQVTIQPNNALATAAGFTVLPSSAYTIVGGLNITIPAGQKQAVIKMTFPNSSLLNPTVSYGLGFTIASVSPGYTIAANQKNIVLGFSIKNKYDGVYRLRVRMRANDRPTVNTTTTWNWGGNVHLITDGPTSVKLFDDWGFGDFIQPIQTNTFVYSGFGFTAPKFWFDASDKVINVTNEFPNPPNGRQFTTDPDPMLNSRFDPATHNVYVDFIMTQPGFGPLKIADTLFYVGPR